MSEKLPFNPEVTIAEAPRDSVERPKAAEYGKAEQEKSIESAKAAVAAAEASTTERPSVPTVEPTDDRPLFIDKAIKTLRMKQNLAHVQNRLKPAEKGFSKVIHQPLVQRVSETSAKTITRPSGMLGGGLVAFVGSLGYLWLTRHYGLDYNYVFFLIFFATGFLLGLAGEYAVHLTRTGYRR